MGRVFEKRKYTMFARFDRMAKAFTKIGKEITIAAKIGGPDPANNPRLRQLIQNAKGVNMPKDRVENAIKRITAKDAKDLHELVYEGYGPHGVAIMVECASDNPTRTVSNLRVHFNRNGGNLGNNGSVEFLFDRKGVFKIAKANINLEEMELDLIDFGADDFQTTDEEVIIYTSFNNFGNMAKGLESKNITVTSAEVQRIPNNLKEVNEAQEEEVLKLIEIIEADDDVQSVYHNLA